MGVFFKYTPGLNPARIRSENKQVRDALYHSLDNEGSVEGLHANTLRAMRKSGIIDEGNKITPRAFYGIVEEMSLQKQCKILGIPLETIQTELIGKPELAAFDYLLQHGYKGGTFCEGGALFTIFKSLCLDVLIETSCIDDEYGVSIRGFLNQCVIIPGIAHLEPADKVDRIKKTMQDTNEDALIDNFRRIYKYPDVQQQHPGITEEAIMRIYQMLGKETILKIANYCIDSVSHHYWWYDRGWPDLTMYNDSKISFIEIKVKDKLLFSQIIIMSLMRDLLKDSIDIGSVELSILKIR